MKLSKEEKLQLKLEKKKIRKANKLAKRGKGKGLTTFLVVIDIVGILVFFMVYGPFDFFKDWFVTSSMTTMTHQYFAHTLYSEDVIQEVLDNNTVIIPDEDTDLNQIDLSAGADTGVYESVYEEQILKRTEGNDVYKVVKLKGSGYNGYMIVVYDPSRLRLVFSSKYGGAGEYLSVMAKRKKALVATNASGVHWNNGNKVTGTAIKDGKVYATGDKINKGGGLIGFTKDNKLMLTKNSAKQAIADGMDRAVEFGPFLVVNGKKTTMKGNGGWGIANRTAIGQRQDGIVLLIAINGRTASSRGISLVGLRDLFVRYKAYNAANLDGGGSSAMYAGGKLINNPVGYGYSGERYLPNAWMVLPQATD